MTPVSHPKNGGYTMAENLTEKLSPKQRRAVESLLAMGNISAAAEAAGVSRETLYRWLARPDFSAALKDAEAAAVESLSRALVGLGDKATRVLGDVMDNTSGSDGAKLRAADIVLSNLLKLRELVELEKRIEELEKRL